MRGFPLLRLSGVAGALLLLGVPVWMLTRDHVESVVESEPAEVEGMVDFSVVLTASAPARLSVTAVNHPLQASNGSERRFEARFEMPRALPEDFVVAAEFGSEGGAEALRAEVRAAGRVVADKTFWGEGEIRDVVGVGAP